MSTDNIPYQNPQLCNLRQLSFLKNTSCLQYCVSAPAERFNFAYKHRHLTVAIELSRISLIAIKHMGDHVCPSNSGLLFMDVFVLNPYPAE